MSKRITVRIGPDGTISAKIEGHSGPSCVDELSTVQGLLPGATVTDSRLTDEYYLQSPQYLPQQEQATLRFEEGQ